MTAASAESKPGASRATSSSTSRIEARREQSAGPREVLRERARAALGLEQLASLERPARCAAQMLGEADVLVGEGPAAPEEDDDRVGLVVHAGDRGAEERAVSLGDEGLAERGRTVRRRRAPGETRICSTADGAR